jgi:Family of unknown function (DUF6174)
MHLRWVVIIGVGLLIQLNSNAPAISYTTVEIAQKKPAIANFRKYRRLWNQQNIRNYSYVLSNSCFCIPEARGPVLITVKHGITTSITSVETGQPVNPEFFERYKAIPKLFDVIADAIAHKASNLDVQYNPQFGYLTQINIDYNSQQADEELYLTIENFQPL